MSISQKVRVSAATLLGKMPQVGPAFLEQTLDKKLMSDMRVRDFYSPISKLMKKIIKLVFYFSIDIESQIST